MGPKCGQIRGYLEDPEARMDDCYILLDRVTLTDKQTFVIPRVSLSQNIKELAGTRVRGARTKVPDGL